MNKLILLVFFYRIIFSSEEDKIKNQKSLLTIALENLKNNKKEDQRILIENQFSHFSIHKESDLSLINQNKIDNNMLSSKTKTTTIKNKKHSDCICQIM